MPSAQIDDAQIYYELHGAATASAKNLTDRRLPLVLSHCLAGNCTLFQDQIEVLAKERPLLLWDCRGHGRSSAPIGRHRYGIRRSVRDLVGLLDHLSIQRVHAGGISMGGGISLGLAMLYPERVDKLLVMDSNTAANLPVPQTVRREREAWVALAEQGLHDELVERFLANNPAYRLVASDSQSMRERVQKMVASTETQAFGHSIHALLDNDLPLERIANWRGQTLVLAGTHDPALEAVRKTHQRIAQSQLVQIADAGHLSNLDNPSEFAEAITSFLQA